MVDEGFDLCFKVTRQEVVFQQDAVFQSLMPSLDLALGLRMIWRTALCFMPLSFNHSARSPETWLDPLSLSNRGL